MLNTHTSATFRISGRNVCKRDGGEWKECKGVLSQGGGDVTLGLQTIIEKEWKRINTKGVFPHSILAKFRFFGNWVNFDLEFIAYMNGLFPMHCLGKDIRIMAASIAHDRS